VEDIKVYTSPLWIVMEHPWTSRADRRWQRAFDRKGQPKEMFRRHRLIGGAVERKRREIDGFR
jgi:hypothetical protein